MTAKDASRIIAESRPDKTITGCLEFPNFYAFTMKDKGYEGDKHYGCCYTVDKSDGTTGTFNPTSNLDAVLSAKKIDIAELL